MKKNIKWGVCILSFIIFLILGYLIKTSENIILDNIFYDFISKFINNNLTNIIKFITFLGSALFVISITVFILIFFKNKKYGLFLALNLIIITIFQYLLKALFSRPRPIDINLIDETNFSFPSGHSLTAMAFYGFIIYLIYNSKIRYKKTCISILLALILSIGLSRVYLGVHYTTDVLGGFCFSLSYLIIYIQIIKKYLYNSN